jgi:N6-L-threonylcarbamoyladenine synthase
MSYSLEIPLICVNHIKAHALSHTINKADIDFPFISLVVSGGHTQIMYVESYDKIKIVGETRDDAVGEAFDKCAKIIGLDYPGGPFIDKLSKKGDPHKYKFPDTNIPNLDFSFSGIKTSFLYFIKDNINNDKNFIKKNINDIAASIQFKLVEMIIKKLRVAIKKYNVSNISIGGGVAANSLLREELSILENDHDIILNISKLEYCTDNAAMIANYARFMFNDKKFSKLDVVPFSKNR